MYTLAGLCNYALSVTMHEDLCSRNVVHFNLFPLLRECSTVAQPYTCLAVAMSLYQIIDFDILVIHEAQIPTNVKS